MATNELSVGVAMSGKAAREARKEERKEERRMAWAEYKHKDLVAIYVILALGALLFALGGVTLLFTDPDVGLSTRIAGSTMILGIWMGVAAGLTAACISTIRTRVRRY